MKTTTPRRFWPMTCDDDTKPEALDMPIPLYVPAQPYEQRDTPAKVQP